MRISRHTCIHTSLSYQVFLSQNIFCLHHLGVDQFPKEGLTFHPKVCCQEQLFLWTKIFVADQLYDMLRTKLIKWTATSKQQKLQQLISGWESGDRKLKLLNFRDACDNSWETSFEVWTLTFSFISFFYRGFQLISTLLQSLHMLIPQNSWSS